MPKSHIRREQLMSFTVVPYRGTPTFFRENQPAFYGLMWGSAPQPKDYFLNDCANQYAIAGVHYFTFDVGTGGPFAEWRGPHPETDSPYDFSTLRQRFQHILDADPQACFHLRIHLEMPQWWQEINPDECELLADGRRMFQSYASRQWRREAKEFLKAFVNALKQAGLSERVVAYQCGTGTSGEWVKGHGAMGLTCGDHSQPMQEHFRQWLRQHYHTLDQLRTAWADPWITFETAKVPSEREQLPLALNTFRDPQKERNVIDYFRCFAELQADLLIDFCSTVKETTGGKALAGAFYGYLTELAWNAGFFGEGLDSEFSTYQRSGHLGLAKVLQSPSIDFLVSPYSYGFRGIGGDGPAMPPSESLRVHGKLYIYEDDTRTYLSTHDHPNFGKTDTLAENLAILQRNFAYAMVHGQGIWWLAGGEHSPHIDLAQEAAFRQQLAQFQRLGSFGLQLNRTPSAEIAVFLDDESLYYENARNSLDIPLIFQQRLWGLAHLGAPYDTYLLSDLISQPLKSYKLYIFLNAFRLDHSQRQAIQHQVQKEQRTALWIYAPGFFSPEENSLENMRDLTGINFGMGSHPWGPLINLTNLSHPITHQLPQDLSWGTNNPLAPIFHVDDPTVTVLGNVVYSQGRCRPGFVVKEFPQWNSIYSAAPALPAPVLRGIARFTGAHIYSDAGDVLYATPDLLAIHTAAGGERTFNLPSRVEVVSELFSGQIIGRHLDRFKLTLPPSSTALFFTGSETILQQFR